MSDAIIVYVCCKDSAQAECIATAAVEERLAACANIIPGTRSIYRWEGKTESTQEVVLLLKTQAVHFEACAALVRRLHSYEVPCIVALPIEKGTPDFLGWLKEQTQLSEDRPCL
ncbi:MAG: divalent-cation tolerance protein CutA [Alphaproteobacteria bacterium]|nr:divalent-cation tolerance protein CutA [Alphaproteobacteria bacterium]